LGFFLFIEKQQQQQYATTTTTKQKTKQKQKKQTVEKTKTAKIFWFDEMIILGISTFAFFFSNHKPPGGGYCHIWATVCATVKGMVFRQFTLG